MENLLNRILSKIAELLWKHLEPKVKESYAEGYRVGSECGYLQGHEDGYMSATDDIIRRLTYLYDEVRLKAKEDALAEIGAIDIEELAEELVDDMEGI